MEKGNPHAGGAGASHVLGRNAQVSITALPTGAILLSYTEATAFADALTTIHQIASRCSGIVIEKLDLADGDPDMEDDDPAGQRDEDGVNTGGKPFFGWSEGAGCPISDPGGCEHDGREPEEGV